LSVFEFILDNGAEALDFSTVHARFAPRREGEIDEGFLRGVWATAARRMGGATIVAAGEPSETELEVLLEVDEGRRFWLRLEIEPDEPHRLRGWTTAPAVPAGITIRRAEAGDAAALVELEREAPIVVGDSSIHFEHEADYFSPWELLEEPGAVVAVTDDGRVLAALQDAVVPIRVNGAVYRGAYAHRVRTHPDHAGLGLLQHLTRAGLEVRPVGVAMDAIVVCIGKGNTAMLKGWAGRPGEWPAGPTRFLIDTTQMGRDAGAAVEVCADLDAAVACLNETHDRDEGYVPYTAQSFRARLNRAPHLYGPSLLFGLGGAVVGLWEAGATVRTVVTRGGVRVTQRRAIAADWGFRPGRDDDLAALLVALCGRLAQRGLTHLAVFASPITPGWEVLSSLASSRDEFHMWTQPLQLAPDADRRGTYVDALAF
jgi:hypothetical protein